MKSPKAQFMEDTCPPGICTCSSCTHRMPSTGSDPFTKTDLEDILYTMDPSFLHKGFSCEELRSLIRETVASKKK